MRLNRLITTPSGRELWTYTAAILEVTGMMSGQAFPLDRFYGNFSGHLTAGRIRQTSDGCVLTKAGYQYFSQRLNGSNGQRIERPDVLQMIRLIVASQPALGWESIESES
jgi:hypothetical protein